jgi:Fe2+ transport system protein FeoA/GTP-binding protein EngB required for normal cell division
MSHTAPNPIRLSQLRRDQAAQVRAVESRGTRDPIAQRLRELGFVADEPVRVVAHAPLDRLHAFRAAPRRGRARHRRRRGRRMNAATDALRVALVGNPNCGKTALFNLLTGSRQKVANYAGVTVERKEGWFVSPAGRRVRVLDLPGAYSLAATSPDEAVTRNACLGLLPGETPPDLIVAVVDATNLRLHLRFVLELRALARPMVVALNMMDEARQRGIAIDVPALQAALGLRVIETVAVQRDGAAALAAALDATSARPELVEGPGLRQAQPERGCCIKRGSGRTVPCRPCHRPSARPSRRRRSGAGRSSSATP